MRSPPTRGSGSWAPSTRSPPRRGGVSRRAPPRPRLAPRRGELFATPPPGPAIDAFSGSGVVAYTLKATGRPTHANDHLTFTATLAQALVANEHERLSAADVARLTSPNRDG